MNNLLLNEILREYEVKRQKAFDEAQKRKEKLSKANPKIAELDRQLAENSIKTTKIMLAADEKEKESLLQNLKKENNKLIREKKAYIKELCKDSNYLNPQFECKMCKDTGFIEKIYREFTDYTLKTYMANNDAYKILYRIEVPYPLYLL